MKHDEFQGNAGTLSGKSALAVECSWSGTARLLSFFCAAYDTRAKIRGACRRGTGLCVARFVCWHNRSRLDESPCEGSETCCQHAFLLITFVTSLRVSQTNKDVWESAKTHCNRAFPAVSHGAGFVQIYPSKSKTPFSLSLRRVRGERNPDLALGEWEVDGRNECIGFSAV